MQQRYALPNYICTYLIGFTIQTETYDINNISIISSISSTRNGQHAQPYPYLCSIFPFTRPHEIVILTLPGETPLQHPISLWYSPHHMHNCTSHNHAMCCLTELSSNTCRPWYGPLVALRYATLNKGAFTDISIVDVTIVATYLTI